MTPALSVSGFGVKIGSTPNVTTVYAVPASLIATDLPHHDTTKNATSRHCALSFNHVVSTQQKRGWHRRLGI
jgi:hypothetical protein